MYSFVTIHRRQSWELRVAQPPDFGMEGVV